MNVSIANSVVRRGGSVLAAMAFALTATSAHATTYSSVGISTSTTGELDSGTYGGGVSNQFSSGNNGYNFIYAAGSKGGAPSGNTCGSVATCAPGQDGPVGMWAIPTNTTTLGANGAFLALDSDFNTASSNNNHGVAVSETVTGLTVGDTYTIVFNTADTQQNTFQGASQDYVTVCFLGICENTNNALDASESATPWVYNTFSFTDTAAINATSTTLSFLGVGGTDPASNNNVPAFALVDDLSITQTAPPPTPEPSSLLLMGTGLAGLAGVVRMRFAKKA